jgi:hypothetical protein
LKYKASRIAFLIVVFCVAIVYFWIGLWTILISYKTGPIWVDTNIYTNRKGNKVISQFRETSGSIYDYRDRLILYEFPKNNRVSIEWSKKLMNGEWQVRDVNKDSIYFKQFNKEQN